MKASIYNVDTIFNDFIKHYSVDKLLYRWMHMHQFMIVNCTSNGNIIYNIQLRFKLKGFLYSVILNCAGTDAVYMQANVIADICNDNVSIEYVLYKFKQFVNDKYVHKVA